MRSSFHTSFFLMKSALIYNYKDCHSFIFYVFIPHTFPREFRTFKNMHAHSIAVSNTCKNKLRQN